MCAEGAGETSGTSVCVSVSVLAGGDGKTAGTHLLIVVQYVDCMCVSKRSC